MLMTMMVRVRVWLGLLRRVSEELEEEGAVQASGGGRGGGAGGAAASAVGHAESEDFWAPTEAWI